MKHLNPVTLWLGVYAISVSLFYYESRSLSLALKMALASSTLKTGWALLHKRLTHTPIHIREDIR